jgi:SAM-dependent methyltransferase
MTPALLTPSSMGGQAIARPRVPKGDWSALENRQEINMKRVGVALLAIVLCAAVSGQTSGQQAPSDPNAGGEIREQTERYFEAMERRDAKGLDDMLADEYQVLYPRGVADTKATLLENFRKAGPSDRTVHAERTLSDVKVQRAGDTAILTATLATKRGDTPAVSNRRTLVWSHQGGHWRLLHDQWSLVGDAREAEFWSDYFRGNNQNFNRKPNALLVDAVQGLQPGKALDVGVGQGRNAIYLAKQGWDVTGFDRAEGALAVARQHAKEQGVKITPILQSFEEFDWGRERWDLVALLYVNAVRGNVEKIRESLKPGGIVVIEAFGAPPGRAGQGVQYKPGELRKLFEEGFEVLRYEETEALADYGQQRTKLVRLVGRKMMPVASCCSRLEPTAMPPNVCRVHAHRSRHGR